MEGGEFRGVCRKMANTYKVLSRTCLCQRVPGRRDCHAGSREEPSIVHTGSRHWIRTPTGGQKVATEGCTPRQRRQTQQVRKVSGRYVMRTVTECVLVVITVTIAVKFCL